MNQVLDVSSSVRVFILQLKTVVHIVSMSVYFCVCRYMIHISKNVYYQENILASTHYLIEQDAHLGLNCHDVFLLFPYSGFALT